MSQTTFKNFKILKRLGRGSYGEVFLVRRTIDNNIYCLKQIHIAHLSQFAPTLFSGVYISYPSVSRAEKRSAVQECHLLAELDSPFIVRYYDSFLEDDALNIVMEYAENGNLSQYIQRHVADGTPIEENIIWKFIVELVLGLQRVFSLHLSSSFNTFPPLFHQISIRSILYIVI